MATESRGLPAETITLVVDGETALIMQAVADEWGLSREETIRQILYRDAASMSGWPGITGRNLRHLLRAAHAGDGEAEMEDLDYPPFD